MTLIHEFSVIIMLLRVAEQYLTYFSNMLIQQYKLLIRSSMKTSYNH